MKTLFVLLSVVGATAFSAPWKHVEVEKVSKEKPVVHQIMTKDSFSLTLLNVLGPNRIYETQSGVEIKLSTDNPTEIPVEISNSNKGRKIEVKYPRDSKAVNVSIGLPNYFLKDLTVKSVSGDVSVEGPFSNEKLEAKRSALIEAVSGEIKVAGLNAKKQITIKSVSGDQNITNTNGPLDLRTVSGEIQSEGGTGDIMAKSISGKFKISGRTADQIKVSTLSGDVTFNNPKVKKETAKSTSGKIEYTKN